jgi:hypothetical protein
MKALVGLLGLVMVASVALDAGAQTKTVTGETKVVTATVEAIEASSRTLTLKLKDGTYTDVTAPAAMKRFDEIKIGDTIAARYYENVVVRVKQPGEKDVDTTSAGAPVTPDGKGGTMARQRTITATISAIDQSIPSITFTGPKGWKYSSKVRDKNALATVKVGDKVDIVWTEALLVSLDPASK